MVYYDVFFFFFFQKCKKNTLWRSCIGFLIFNFFFWFYFLKWHRHTRAQEQKNKIHHECWCMWLLQRCVGNCCHIVCRRQCGCLIVWQSGLCWRRIDGCCWCWCVDNARCCWCCNSRRAAAGFEGIVVRHRIVLRFKVVRFRCGTFWRFDLADLLCCFRFVLGRVWEKQQAFSARDLFRVQAIQPISTAHCVGRSLQHIAID